VEKVRQSPDALDAEAYEALAKPSIGHAVEYYSAYEDGLFQRILAKYAQRPAASMNTDN
jgi:cytochrome o ubiquinol oxidase subunit 2